MDIKEKKLLIQKTLYEFIKEGEHRRYLFNEEESFTFDEVLKIASHTAFCLSKNGVKKGSLVAVRATRSLQTWIIIVSLHIIGAVCAVCDAHENVKSFIANSGVVIDPDFYITNEQFSLDTSCGEGWKLLYGTFEIPVILEKGNQDECEWANSVAGKVLPTDPTLILFTSGSTGKKKACVLCQQNYITAALDGSDVFGETENDITALVLPLYHILDYCVPVYAAVDKHSVFFPSSAKPIDTLKNIEKYKVTVLHAVPSYLISLAEEQLKGQYDISSFVKSLIAGGPYTYDQANFIENTLGIRLIPVYGMSEYVAISTCSYLLDGEIRNRSVGKFYPLNEGVILGADGNKLAVGEVGEICVRGYDKMLGYYNDPEATRALIDEEGYVHSGDLGYVDENGFLHITGRKKDIIIRNGVNLSAVAIENKILELSQIKDAAVVGVPDKKLGEVPVAAVVLYDDLTVKQVEDLFSMVLNKQEAPKKTVILSEIPLTASGKKDKQKIKSLF